MQQSLERFLVDDDVPKRNSKSHGAVDPSVAVQPTDLGDIRWSWKPNGDFVARRPIGINPVAAPFLRRRPGISGWSSTS